MKFLDARREFQRIAGRVTKGIFAVTKQFATTADKRADHWQTARHRFKRHGGKRFFPFGGIKQGIMLSINRGQVSVLV